MTKIGVAVAVPEPWAGELERYRASFGDLLAHSIPAHVTLLPPTQVTSGLRDVERHLAGVAALAPPFALRLQGTGSFRPVSPVVFVVVTQGIALCEKLAGEVRRGPLEQDLAYPYHPHVTVAHDLDDASLDAARDRLAGFGCTFDATAFHLYVHDDDGVWRPRRTFQLEG
ncbi:MAG: 2'-5' RNA ligase family protein [Nocardioidaceae bacterium]